MKNRWKEVRLGDVVILNYGKALTSANRVTGTIPVYSSAGITGYHNTPLVNSEGIIVGRKGTVGTVYYSPNPFFCIDTAYYILPSENYSLKYMYYRIRSLGLEKLNEDSAVPGLNRDTAYSQTFSLPPLSVQRAIAATLSCFDDKIANNTKINHHLEQMAQAVFKSWFVDFEPWGGVMPDDWREGTLSDIANITMGQSPDGTSYNEDGIGTVFYQGRAEFGSRFPTRHLYTTQPKRMVAKGDVLISVRAPVGDLNVAFEPCCLGRGLAGIQSNSGCQSFILYTMFDLRQQLDIFNGEGTVFGSINKNDMANLHVLIPTNEVIRQFEGMVRPMDASIEANYAESCNLQTARDILLPRLMSGEISVS